jgi:hypothetical protein
MVRRKKLLATIKKVVAFVTTPKYGRGRNMPAIIPNNRINTPTHDAIHAIQVNAFISFGLNSGLSKISKIQ